MGWKAVIGCGQNGNDTSTIGNQAPAIIGGSYDGPTGTVTLNLASTPAPSANWVPGVALNISGVTGSGTQVSSVNGTFVAAAGTGSTTLKYVVTPNNLNITGINAGGNLVWNGNNSSIPFTAYGPIGSSICTATWAIPTPSVGSYDIGQMLNNCPHTASLMTAMAGGSVSSPLSSDFFNRLVWGPTASQVQGQQIAKFSAGTTYNSGTPIQDVNFTDAIPAGVPAALSQGWTGSAPGTGAIVYTGVFWQADQPGGACVPFNTGIGVTTTGQLTISAPTARFYGVGGGTHLNTVIGQNQVSVPVAGAWSMMTMNVRGFGVTNVPTSGSFNLKSCVNTLANYNVVGAGNNNGLGTGQQIISVAAGATAGPQPADVTHTDAVPAGSYVSFLTTDTLNNSGVIAHSGFGSTWTSAQLNATPLMACDVNQNGGTGEFWRGQVGYMTLRIGKAGNGTIGPAGSVSEGPCRVPTAGTFSQMNVTTFTSGGTSTTAYSLVADATGNQIISNPFAATGTVSDATHSDAIVANSAFQFGYDGGGAGGGVPTGVSMASQAVAFFTPNAGGGLLLMGIG